MFVRESLSYKKQGKEENKLSVLPPPRVTGCHVNLLTAHVHLCNYMLLPLPFPWVVYYKHTPTPFKVGYLVCLLCFYFKRRSLTMKPWKTGNSLVYQADLEHTEICLHLVRLAILWFLWQIQSSLPVITDEGSWMQRPAASTGTLSSSLPGLKKLYNCLFLYHCHFWIPKPPTKMPSKPEVTVSKHHSKGYFPGTKENGVTWQWSLPVETTLTWPHPSLSKLAHSSSVVLHQRHGSTSVQLVLKPSSEKSRPHLQRVRTLVNCECCEGWRSWPWLWKDARELGSWLHSGITDSFVG